MGQMRLLIATPLYPPDSGGPATYAKLLEEELPGIGTEVTVVSFGAFRAYPKVIRHALYFFELCKKVWGVDAVYALDGVSVGVPAWMCALLARKPLYIRIAGDYAWEQGTQRFGVTETLDAFVKNKTQPLFVRFFIFVQTFVARRARRIVVPSEYLKSIVETWSIPAKKISVVHNAPPVLPQKLPASEHAPEAPYIVSVARLVPWKGMAGLIRAVANIPNLPLLIVGAGPEANALQALVKEKSLESQVVFTGALPHDETLAVVSRAQAFMLNTNYEGFSHTLLEVFALGVPVLSTAVGGNAELLVHEKNALIFSYDDEDGMTKAITRIQEDTEFCGRIVREATHTLKEFSRERTTRETKTALSLI